MNDQLTKMDIQKMQQELDKLRDEWPAVIEEVKRTRAFGDLSENYEYKAAKQAQRHSMSRQRYLENMIKTAVVIKDDAKDDEVGLFDKVEIYIEEDDETQVMQIVSTIRVDPMKGLVSRESPFGRAVLGKKVGDEVTVVVSDTYSYKAVIKSITKQKDDGSAPILEY